MAGNGMRHQHSHVTDRQREVRGNAIEPRFTHAHGAIAVLLEPREEPAEAHRRGARDDAEIDGTLPAARPAFAHQLRVDQRAYDLARDGMSRHGTR
jgi:hypothetical protein